MSCGLFLVLQVKDAGAVKFFLKSSTDPCLRWHIREDYSGFGTVFSRILAGVGEDESGVIGYPKVFEDHDA